MNKHDVVHDMQMWTGSGFITAKKLAVYLGVKDAHKVRQKYLQGLDRIGNRYFIPDVAERLVK